METVAMKVAKARDMRTRTLRRFSMDAEPILESTETIFSALRGQGSTRRAPLCAGAGDLARSADRRALLRLIRRQAAARIPRAATTRASPREHVLCGAVLNHRKGRP